MRISIIGAGAVGAALAEGWARAGHTIALGVRDINKPEYVALAEKTGAALTSVAASIEGAEVVAFAVPWSAAEDALAALGDLGGKVLIDATNPLEFKDNALHLVQPDGVSGGELVAGWAQNARVVKTLNQVGSEMMSAEKNMPAKPCMFIAGDDQNAVDTASKLVEDIGFEALQAGGLAQARHLENFAMVWINQAIFRGFGRNWAFGALRHS